MNLLCLLKRKTHLAILFLFISSLSAESPTGTVSGFVLDSQTGRPIPSAVISINGQSTRSTVSDASGRFAIPLSTGTYQIRISEPNYSSAELSEVVVKAGETTEASTVMSNKALVTKIDVVEHATAVGATAEANLQERKLSCVVSDSLSRDELSAGTSSDAAGALQKVTGVSVVGSGFVYVR